MTIDIVEESQKHKHCREQSKHREEGENDWTKTKRRQMAHCLLEKKAKLRCKKHCLLMSSKVKKNQKEKEGHF
jgi:hypothetical protein